MVEAFIFFFFPSAEAGDECGAVDLTHADGEKEKENGTGARGAYLLLILRLGGVKNLQKEAKQL